MTVFADFNRAMLRGIHREVKARHPRLDLRSALVAMKQFDGRQWFVEGHVGSTRIRWTGRAEDAAHAKYLAWSDYLKREA